MCRRHWGGGGMVMPRFASMEMRGISLRPNLHAIKNLIFFSPSWQSLPASDLPEKWGLALALGLLCHPGEGWGFPRAQNEWVPI